LTALQNPKLKMLHYLIFNLCAHILESLAYPKQWSSPIPTMLCTLMFQSSTMMMRSSQKGLNSI